MNITIEKLMQLDGVAGSYVKRIEGENKLKYAIENKISKQITEIYKSYNELVQDINIDHCYVDEKNVIIRDEKGDFKFTKEELKKKIEKVKLLLKKEFHLNPYIVEDFENSMLTEGEIELFSGIIIPEQNV